MRNLLLLLLLFCSAGFAQNTHSSLIDASLVKVDDLLWDLKALSKSPEIEWAPITGNVRSLLYKSVDYEGKTTQVFAYYSNPDLLMGRKASGKKFPGVVLVHGGGGRAFKEWVEKWAADGYAAIAMDLSGNDGDRKKLAFAGADQIDTNKFEKIEKGDIRDVWTYHAISSVILAHSLLLNLPEVDASKTCVTGISWGGYLTCLVASLDNRFKAAAPVYGCGFYNLSEIFGQSLNHLSNENQQKWMKYFDPSSYLPFAQPPFLFINGNKDFAYGVIPCHKTYSLIGKDHRTISIIPDMRHGHNEGWAPPEIHCFFESVLNNGVPLTKIVSIHVEETEIKLTYQSPVSLSRAEFYYTNDTITPNVKRDWIMQKTSINREKHTVTIPKLKEGFKFGFFYLTDIRNISVSGEFIVN
jgi:dienelactone hydrolase